MKPEATLPADLRRVAVLAGGSSNEREVSLRTGTNVLASLKRLGFEAELVDVSPDLPERLRAFEAQAVFVALHGGTGEDGTIQGLLETLDIPYTGSGVYASAVCMNKVASKAQFSLAEVPTPEFTVVAKEAQSPAEAAAEALERLGLPLVVKPAAEGSSVGVRITRTQPELEAALAEALASYDLVLVERFIEGPSITVGVLGSGDEAWALPVLELIPQGEFYDYEAKYTPGATEFVIPARLPDETYQQVQALAVKAHRLLHCHGYSRVDMQVEAAGNRPFVLEVNTLPGLTDTSDLPAEAEAVGISYDELVKLILASAFDRR